MAGRMRRLLPLAFGLALATATGAAADPALEKLVPLLEVYDARKASPGFDVAGIRCAGLFAAQSEWARKNPGAGRPSKARMQDVEDNLTRAEVHRRKNGQDIVQAQESTKADVLRVIGLYTARFRSNTSGGGHPWQADGLIRGDTGYCDILGGRR